MEMTESVQKKKILLKIIKRQSLVRQLAVRGLSYREIANRLENEGYAASAKTIQRDLTALREGILNDLQKGMKPTSAILTDLIMKCDEVTRELWHLYDSTTRERVKIRCLAYIGRTLDSKAKILSSLGLVRQAALPMYTGNDIDVRQMVAIVKKEYRTMKEEETSRNATESQFKDHEEYYENDK